MNVARMENLEELLEELNKKYPIKKIRMHWFGPFIGTLGRVEEELAAATLFEFWRRKGKICPVRPQDIAEMYNEDEKKYKEVNKCFEERIQQASILKRLKWRIQLFFAPTIEVSKISLSGEVERFGKKVKLPKELRKIYQEIEEKVGVPFNPLLKPGMEIIAYDALRQFSVMAKEGLLIIKEEGGGDILIPTERLLQPIFEQYAME